MSLYGGDVYLYFGQISKRGYQQLSDLLERRSEKSEKACLLLVTAGGDPDAAYRMARAFRHHYKRFEVLVADYCKSAGTLLCIGADSLIIGDRGELGPLDIQISKRDEMFESMSGLEIVQAMSALQRQTYYAFRSYLVDFKKGSGIQTKIAADIAMKLATGFISPIAAKIDPVTLGEHQRAMSIGNEYGNRLLQMSGSMTEDSLARLVSDYPSHGFVIDRKEAGELFTNVVAPEVATELLYEAVRVMLREGSAYGDPLVEDLKSFLDNSSDDNDEDASTDKESEESESESTKNDGESDEKPVRSKTPRRKKRDTETPQ